MFDVNQIDNYLGGDRYRAIVRGLEKIHDAKIIEELQSASNETRKELEILIEDRKKTIEWISIVAR